MKRTRVTSTILALIVIFLFSPLLPPDQARVLAAQEWGGVLLTGGIMTLADSPYDLTGDLVIPTGATLLIQAGVTVNGHHHSIIVLGTLVFMAPASPCTLLINTALNITGQAGQVLTGGCCQLEDRNAYTIACTISSDGTTTSAEVVEVEERASKMFVVDRPSGQYLRNVVVDGISLGPLLSYTFQDVRSNHTIAVEFSNTKSAYITATAGSGGTITPSGVSPVDEAGTLTFSIQADAHSSILDVVVDGQSVGAVSSYSFANVTADHSIVASFKTEEYTIAASAGANGSISPDGTVTVAKNADQSFTITPNAGYHIADVSVDGMSQGILSSYNFANLTTNHVITATFEQDKKPTIIVLQIGNLTFTVNGTSKTLDSPPVIKNGRTLVPLRAIAEVLGATIGWDSAAKRVILGLGSISLELWIGKSAAAVNGVSTPIDSANTSVVPEIINGRTMLPLRFVTESLGATLGWDAGTQTITITYAP
jgi:hypothetical protein